MKIFILFATLGWSCVALVVPQQQTLPMEKLDGISYALDLSQSVSVQTFECMLQYGYTVVFLRAYSPAGQGQPDPNVVYNVQNAYNAGLGSEVYMTPQPNSGKTGQQQFMEMFSYLSESSITVRTVWIQVTSPVNWLPSTGANINFISSILASARSYGVKVGIYTSNYDWYQITNGMYVDGTMLWYWNVFGPGSSGESPANFNDFRPFGEWYSAVVKQFAQVESVCGVTVNRDIYVTNSLMGPISAAEIAKTKQIVVGNFGLGNTTSSEEIATTH